jgi:hypothetical protein
MLGTSVSSFAYPFGFYDHRSYQIVKRHFTCACTGNLALTRAQNDLYKLPRVDAYYLRHERLIDLMFSSAFPWYLLARAIPRGLRNMMTPLVHRTTISPSSPSHAEIERP